MIQRNEEKLKEAKQNSEKNWIKQTKCQEKPETILWHIQANKKSITNH